MKCALCRRPEWRAFRRAGRALRLCRICASWLMCELQGARVNPQEWLRGSDQDAIESGAGADGGN